MQPPESTKQQSSYLQPVNAAVDIIVSHDEQAAYLGIRPPQNGGKDLTAAQLMTELELRHINYGIINEAVTALANEPVYNTMVQVAQGALPVQGTDARLTFHFSTNREIKPKERQDGTVDYRDLGLIESVVADQPLCTLTPAFRGTPGRTVTGRILNPDPVRNLSLPLGKNVKQSEDKLVLLAAINGSVEFVSGKVNVLNVFTVKGDVSNATGNVNFDGSVVVNGNVLTGFTVKVTGSITVMGNVQGAVLDAGADIRIAAGLVGQGRGRAVCGGNFKALFVENAEIFAAGDVSADVFMHAQVRCGGSLIADGRKGTIIGGTYIVGRDVRALIVGTQSGVATVFELGVDPTVNEKTKYIGDRTKVLDNELRKLNQIIQLLLPLKAADKLPPDRAEMLNKAIATKANYEQELIDLSAEREVLAGASRSLTSQLACKRDLYYGTKVTICQVPYIVPSDMLRCRIYLGPNREILTSSIG